MKKIIILMVCLWGFGNSFTSAQTTEKEKFISDLMKQMTLDEKIGQLAPMHCISPLANAGFSIFAASIEPAAEPAPTMV